MSSILTTSAKIVIDAGVAVWTIIPLMSSVDLADRIAQWRQAGVEIYAPSLWYSETTSVIRRGVSTNMITPQEGRIALDDLIALDITVVAMTPAHCRSALAWAEQMGQSKAYDSFYLALADEIGATFYTTDQRLVNSARQKGLSWVKWVGE
jgi:predicted nucleic acid-binding protein